VPVKWFQNREPGLALRRHIANLESESTRQAKGQGDQNRFLSLPKPKGFLWCDWLDF